MNATLSVTRIIFLDALRRRAIVGLLLLALFLVSGGMLYVDFIGYDIGRASSDYILSVIWACGLLFLFFLAAPALSIDEEHHAIYAILSRPVSRISYVLGVFGGLFALLCLLFLMLGIMGMGLLSWIHAHVQAIYFPEFNIGGYTIAIFGALVGQAGLLAALIFFSSLLRGAFLVQLGGIAYYLVCSGLPVVRESIARKVHSGEILSRVMDFLSMAFPSFSDLDFKMAAINAANIMDGEALIASFAHHIVYAAIVLTLACIVYARRNL